MIKQNWETAPRLTSHDEQLIGMRRFRNIVEGSSSIDKWVDLGLPSGLLWASTNIGAEKPEEYGLYFAWGETQGYEGITIDKQFTWEDYKWCNGSYNTLTKYNYTSTYGTIDNLTTLEQVDDAAYQSDNTCRMPTKTDLEELIANTTSTWETLNDVNGRRFTSKINGNSIFVPAAGYCYYGSNDTGFEGYLQSSSLYEGNSGSGWYLYFDSGDMGIGVGRGNTRLYGQTIRAVKSIN